MMLLVITTLLSFPLVNSHRLSKSRITVTKNQFSCHYKKQIQTIEYKKNMNLYKRLIISKDSPKQFNSFNAHDLICIVENMGMQASICSCH